MSSIPYLQSLWRLLWPLDWMSRILWPVWKWLFPYQTEITDDVSASAFTNISRILIIKQATSQAPLAYNTIGMDYRPPIIRVLHDSRNAIVAKLEDNVVLKYSRYAWWDYPDVVHSMVQEAKNSFLVEEKILEVLGDHPRIVQFLGSYTPQGLKFAEADKGNLQQYINNYFPELTPDIQASWYLQASEAVAYIHSKGVLHSDLRPENYLLYSRSNGQIDLRLCDFGGSKYSDLYGGNLPDPGFFNPQQGSDPTQAVDIFSLGSIFFTISSGHWPYWEDGESPRSYQEKVDDLFSRGEFPSVDHIPTGSIIKGCWTEVYATAALLLEDCRNYYASLVVISCSAEAGPLSVLGS